MIPTNPTFGLDRFPEGTKAVVYAKDQPEYQPLAVYRQPDGTVVSCWMPSEDELTALLAGEPLVIEVLTFHQPLQPLKVYVAGREQ